MKIRTTVAAAACIASLAACSSGTATSSSSPSSSGSTVSGQGASKDVALVLGVKGSPFYEALACGAKSEASKLGLNLTVSAPDQFAADSQVPVVNAVAARKPGVAALVPTDAQALMAPVTNLTRAGTKVITVDQTLADPKAAQAAIITDNEKGGKLAAEEMNKLLHGKGKVLLITQPPGSTAQDARTKGFEEQIKKYLPISTKGHGCKDCHYLMMFVISKTMLENKIFKKDRQPWIQIDPRKIDVNSTVSLRTRANK